MADLFNLYRLLYHTYNANYEGKKISVADLQTDDELKFMHMNKELGPSLLYLTKNYYVEGPEEDLQLTGKGLQTTVTLFRKFLVYMKLYDAEDLSYWTNNLELYRNQIQKLMSNIYFYVEVKREPAVVLAFKEYLKDVERIENVINF